MLEEILHPPVYSVTGYREDGSTQHEEQNALEAGKKQASQSKEDNQPASAE